MSISLDDSFFIYFFFLIVDLQLWIGIVVVVSDFQIALHPIHATIYGNLKCEKKCLYLISYMKFFSIEKNLLIGFFISATVNTFAEYRNTIEFLN